MRDTTSRQAFRGVAVIAAVVLAGTAAADHHGGGLGSVDPKTEREPAASLEFNEFKDRGVESGDVDDGVEVVSLSHDGSVCAYLTRDKSGSARRLNVAVRAGKDGFTFKHTRCDLPGVAGCRVTADGKQVVCETGAGVTVWDVAAGKVTTQVKVDGLVAVSPDGTRAVVRDAKTEAAALWQLDPRKELIRLGEKPGARWVFNPDWSRVAVPEAKLSNEKKGEGYSVRVLDTATGKEVARCDQFPVEKYAEVFAHESHSALSPDGTTLTGLRSERPKADAPRTAESGCKLTRIDLTTGKAETTVVSKERLESDQRPTHSPDGRRVVFTESLNSRTALRVVDVTSGKVELTRTEEYSQFTSYNRPQAAVVSGDGRLLAVVTRTSFELYDLTERRVVLDGADKHLIRRWAFTPDGGRAAGLWAGGGTGGVGVWDTATAKQLAAVTMEKEPGNLAVSPDGAFVAASFTRFDGNRLRDQVTVWDVATGKPLPAAEKEEVIDARTVRCLAVAPGGNLVAAGTEEGKLLVWNPAATDPRRELDGRGGEERTAAAVSFSPDGKRVLMTLFTPRRGKEAAQPTTGRAVVWDVATGKETASRDDVRWWAGAAFSPDGAAVVTAAADKGGRGERLLVWAADGGKVTADPLFEGGGVQSVGFGPDAKGVVAKRHDGLVLCEPGAKSARPLAGSAVLDGPGSTQWALTPKGEVLVLFEPPPPDRNARPASFLSSGQEQRSPNEYAVLRRVPASTGDKK